MGGSIGFTARGYHLVEGTSLRELGVELAAEFTRPTGACVEAIDDGWVDVVHDERLLGRAETDSPGCEAESQSSASGNLSILTDAFVLQGTGLFNPPVENLATGVVLRTNPRISGSALVARGIG
jgi:hypothetical protein